MNPSGFVFVIGCFSAAPGVMDVGGPSDHWSWFPGFTWQIEVCRGCLGHIGWRFRGGDGGFHALVLERLVPDESGDED